MKLKKSKYKIDKGIVISVGLLILSIILIFIPYNYFHGKGFANYKIVIDDYGNLGSFIAGITSPFISIAAFILLYLTYKSQKTELEATQKVLEKQDSTLRKQQFESTFFNLLDAHKKLVENLGTREKGVEFFKKVHYDMIDNYKIVKNHFEKADNISLLRYAAGNTTLTKRKLLELIDSFMKGDVIIPAKYTYHFIFSNNHLYLGHYFRNLYHILKFINERINEEKLLLSNTNDEKLFEIFKTYADILQSTMSSYELSLLFYNILFFSKMKELVVTFGFLENLAIEDLLEEEHKDFFKDIVFSNRSYKLKI